MAKIIKLDDKVSSDVAENKLTPQEISDDEDEEYERYIPVEQSIIGSLLEVREMIAGRMPKRTLDEFFAELDEEIKAMEEEERAKVNEKRRANKKVYG
ncbi:MAG: hypothetical protein IJS29_01865 [Selenomonadaceae bacterium]|nr:hypothetical protein [Selenomonadaceae bacterium]